MKRSILVVRSIAALLLVLLLGAAWAQDSAGDASAKSPVNVCLAPASAQMGDGNADAAATAVQDTFTKFLTGPSIKVTLLSARLASQAREEAKQGNCGHVLFTSVVHKKKEGGSLFSRIAGDAASSAVWNIPGGGGAASATARSAATSAASSALRMATYIKAKDELTLEYKLEAPDRAAPLLSKTEKAKAKSDGEDLLTPLVQKASEAIVTATKR
jgi:hypothetical protein